MMRRLRVSLYWIYIRSAYGPMIVDSNESDGAVEMTPERALHEFFSGLGASYRAYTAESREGLEQAIADVNRLQNLPVRYWETVGRRDLSAACLAAGLGGLLLLLAARLVERSSW